MKGGRDIWGVGGGGNSSERKGKRRKLRAKQRKVRVRQIGARRSYLVPSHQQLWIRILEKPSDVCTHELETSDTHGEQHGNGHPQVAPVRGVVSSPHRTWTIITPTSHISYPLVNGDCLYQISESRQRKLWRGQRVALCSQTSADGRLPSPLAVTEKFTTPLSSLTRCSPHL